MRTTYTRENGSTLACLAISQLKVDYSSDYLLVRFDKSPTHVFSVEHKVLNCFAINCSEVGPGSHIRQIITGIIQIFTKILFCA